MIRAIAALSTALLASASSMAAAFAVSRLRDFEIGDAGGVIYLYVATPAVAALAAVLLMVAVPGSLDLARRSALVLALITGASGLVHYGALSGNAIGGSYRLPDDFNAARQSGDALKRLARAPNHEIAGAAVDELGRRGATGADALMELIGEERRRAGDSYIDSPLTIRVVEILAKQRERRVIPVLEGMLSSHWTVVVTTFDAAGKSKRVAVFTTRQRAVRSLSEEFGVRSMVETRRPLP